MGEWIQIKKSGKHVGKIGDPLSDLWKWSLGYRMPRTSSELGASQASQLAYSFGQFLQGNLPLHIFLVFHRLGNELPKTDGRMLF